LFAIRIKGEDHMPNYQSPGIYIEEPPSGARPIQGVSTSVAAFIGFTPRGDSLKPTLITSWDQFCVKFGVPKNAKGEEIKSQENGAAVTLRSGVGAEANGRASIPASYDPYKHDYYLPYAVYGFFENGGSRCYIVRANRDQQNPQQESRAAISSATDGNRTVLELVCKDAIGSGRVEVQAITPAQPATATATAASAGANAAASGSTPAPATPPAPAPADEKYRIDVYINDGSEPVTVQEASFKTKAKRDAFVRELQAGLKERGLNITVNLDTSADIVPTTGTFRFESASLPAPANNNEAEYTTQLAQIKGERANRTGLEGLQIADDVSIICCPDLMTVYNNIAATDIEKAKTQVEDIQKKMASLCEKMKDRMAILDCLPDLGPDDMEAWHGRLGISSAFTALYYPWIEVTKVGSQKLETIAIPPCGHIAGVWARTDTERGVYKAPANETVRGALRPTQDLTRAEHDGLNPKGVNCIRTFTGRGPVIYGARTLATVIAAEWRYINVRRLFNFVEKSIENSLQWVVFEPNDQNLWARVTRDISAFLTTVWRDGALFGTTPSQAFYVKCDEELNPVESRDQGYLIVEIGMAPVKPAEFVVFRFKQWTEGS
jgi:phage tail sheath protein FI